MRQNRIPPLEERFFKKFEVDEISGCWVWTGALDRYGYGQVGDKPFMLKHGIKGRILGAHRVSWILHHGAIPKGDGPHGTCIMHRCDNRACVNPDHLMIGSQLLNLLDKESKGRGVSPAGSKHGQAKIKDEESLLLIRSTKGRALELANRFGCHVSTIFNIRARKCYR